MGQSTLIIITGMPGTGKTTLANLLATRYGVLCISKDALKDRMFDTLGTGDKTWSRKLSAASHRIIDYIAEEELAAGKSVIIESNFKHNIDSARFRDLQTKHACNIIQILCWAEGETAFQRFAKRIGTAERHTGHVEELPLEQIHAEFVAANGKDQPLNVPGSLIALDTTHLDRIDYHDVYSVLESAGLHP